MPVKQTTQQFINKARAIHGSFYSYDKVLYTNNRTKVTITCPIHGDFQQTPRAHTNAGQGCPKCGKAAASQKRVYTPKEFIAKAKEVHGDFYSYHKMTYVNIRTPIIITCPIHGDFEQVPHYHLSCKNGCPECGNDRVRQRHRLNTSDTETFIAKAIEVHNGFYSYHKVVYTHSKTPVIITCPIHGDFRQTPLNHLNDHGCYECGREQAASVRKLDTDEFIARATEVHNGFYLYNKSHYIDIFTPLTIVCPVHGEFEQTPHHHLNGHGCFLCANFSSGEQRIAEFLDNLNISYTQEKRFDNCRHKKPLPFDFHFSINGKNFLIEYDGVHHFEPVTNWGGQDRLALVQYHDAIKDDFADQHDYILIRVPYTTNDIEVFLQEKLEKYISQIVR